MKQPFHNPFAQLEGLKDKLPDKPAPAPAAEGTQRSIPRAVLRLERKGRGGKEVTYIEKLGLAGDALEEFCKALKHGLGCGGHVEGDAVVLQGDQRERAEELLKKRGVKKVTK